LYPGEPRYVVVWATSSCAGAGSHGTVRLASLSTSFPWGPGGASAFLCLSRRTRFLVHPLPPVPAGSVKASKQGDTKRLPGPRAVAPQPGEPQSPHVGANARHETGYGRTGGAAAVQDIARGIGALKPACRDKGRLLVPGP